VAVHRLEGEELVFHLDLEHVVPVMLPVPRLLPQLLVDEHGGGNLLVPAGIEVLAGKFLELAHDEHAVGQPEGLARRHIEEVEQIQLTSELAVIALLGLFEPPQVLVELLLGRPRRAVDPLQHRVLLVAAPVGAGRGEKPEGPELPRGGHVRTTAEIDEVALPIERHALGVDPLEDLHLERFAALTEKGNRLRPRHLLALEGQVGPHQGTHLVLDAREVLRCEWLRPGEVVVEAVLDGGTDGDLHTGEQPLDRLGHHVRGGVSQSRERRGIAVELAGQLDMPLFFSLGHRLQKRREHQKGPRPSRCSLRR
jgi:hypothetical protein